MLLFRIGAPTTANRNITF